MYFVGKTQYVVVWLRCLVIKNDKKCKRDG